MFPFEPLTTLNMSGKRDLMKLSFKSNGKMTETDELRQNSNVIVLTFDLTHRGNSTLVLAGLSAFGLRAAYVTQTKRTAA